MSKSKREYRVTVGFDEREITSISIKERSSDGKFEPLERAWVEKLPVGFSKAAKALGMLARGISDLDEVRREANSARRVRQRSQTKSTEGLTTPGIPASRRDLLVKALGLLGSEHGGERANATVVVEKQRAALGLAWDELIIPAAVQTQARAA